MQGVHRVEAPRTPSSESDGEMRWEECPRAVLQSLIQRSYKDVNERDNFLAKYKLTNLISANLYIIE